MINKEYCSSPNSDSSIILAVETSGRCGSVALVTSGECLAEYSLNTKLTHSRRLLLVIEELLLRTELDLSQLSGLAVSLGPGSFTGLRIGLSTIKGLAMATELPMIGVPTLDALAFQLPFVSLPICAIMDARKKEIFAAFYRWQKDGRLAKTSGHLAVDPYILIKNITEPTLFIGDGIKTYGELLREHLGKRALFAPSETCFARASSIGRLALDKMSENDYLDSAAAKPLYIRASDAEINLSRK